MEDVGWRERWVSFFFFFLSKRTKTYSDWKWDKFYKEECREPQDTPLQVQEGYLMLTVCFMTKGTAFETLFSSLRNCTYLIC